eukprot:7043649-Prymnesium_polylepis.1
MRREREADEELSIPIAAENGRVDRADDRARVELAQCKLDGLVEHAQLRRAVAHDALARFDNVAARLELGLDEGNQARARARPVEQRPQCGQHELERYEGDVDHDRVEHWLRQLAAGERARVDAFEGGHAPVRRKARVQLVVPAVDAHRGRSARLQQAVCEAARRGAHVQDGRAGHVDGKGVQRRAELLARARDVTVGIASDLERNLWLKIRRRLVHDGTVHPHLARLDRSLGLRARFAQAARDEQRVESEDAARESDVAQHQQKQQHRRQAQGRPARSPASCVARGCRPGYPWKNFAVFFRFSCEVDI